MGRGDGKGKGERGEGREGGGSSSLYGSWTNPPCVLTEPICMYVRVHVLVVLYTCTCVKFSQVKNSFLCECTCTCTCTHIYMYKYNVCTVHTIAMILYMYIHVHVYTLYNTCNYCVDYIILYMYMYVALYMYLPTCTCTVHVLGCPMNPVSCVHNANAHTVLQTHCSHSILPFSDRQWPCSDIWRWCHCDRLFSCHAHFH